MARIRLSTTVDSALLTAAKPPHRDHRRRIGRWAFRALLARHRAAEIDASYAAYDELPADQPDEWGPCLIAAGGRGLVGVPSTPRRGVVVRWERWVGGLWSCSPGTRRFHGSAAPWLRRARPRFEGWPAEVTLEPRQDRFPGVARSSLDSIECVRRRPGGPDRSWPMIGCVDCVRPLGLRWTVLRRARLIRAGRGRRQ